MTKTYNDKISKTFFSLLLGTIVFGFLIIISRYNYLIFHTLAEFFSIVIAWSLFIIIWNTRKMVKNDALVFLGIAYLFIGGLDLFHTLSYKGMGVLSAERGANPATQLWIIARYTESITLCMFPFLLGKRIKVSLPIGVYSIILGTALSSILIWDLFPACYIDGVGLTIYKKNSEYIICMLLMAALFFLYKKKNLLGQIPYIYLVVSIVFTIIAELAFTFYVSVYGLSNLIGHIFKIISFYLIYKAFIYTGLTKPFSLMFKEISDKEERFRLLFENAPLPYQSLNYDGIILEVNQNWLDTLGYKKEEVIGESFGNFLLPEMEDHFKYNFPRFKDKGEILGVEFEMVKKDNSVIIVRFDGKVGYDSDGKFKQTHCVFLDMTEVLQAEKEKEILQSQLQQAVKMQAVGTLAGGIAHEFNNLLGVIMGCTDMARDEVPSDSFAKIQLDNVMTASYRVKDLVKQILAFSRQAQQKRISVDLSSVVKESLKLIQTSIPSSVEVKENINPSCGNAHVDPTEIQQIIMNLTSNAVWAMKENGTIEISMNQVNLTAKEASSLSLSEDRFIKLTYSDNGQGMDNTTRSRIFDPFYTEKEVGEGTGMGLSIIYAIMESYKGAITVESESGKGTTFHLYFPVSDELAVVKPEEIEEIPRGSERILFVDDNDVYAEMGAEMIGRLGYDVDLRMNSREALNAFKADPENYDLIITDQVMPDLSGEKLVQEIRTIKPDMPIILCTGYSSQMNDEKARMLGIDKFAYKPIVKKDIAVLIRKVLDNN